MNNTFLIFYLLNNMRSIFHSPLNIYQVYKLTSSKRLWSSEAVSKIKKKESKVPQIPHSNSHIYNRKNKIALNLETDQETLLLLERLSLVGINCRDALKVLESSIEFASVILDTHIDGVEPLYSVLEDRILRLREDVVTDGNIRDDVLSNARKTEEEYFLAPPGNIPLEQEKNKF